MFVATSNIRARGHQMKSGNRLETNQKKCFFMQWETDLWISLLRDVMNAGSFHKLKGKVSKVGKLGIIIQTQTGSEIPG